MNRLLTYLLQPAAASLILSRLIQTWYCECDSSLVFQGLLRTPVYQSDGDNM